MRDESGNEAATITIDDNKQFTLTVNDTTTWTSETTAASSVTVDES